MPLKLPSGRPSTPAPAYAPSGGSALSRPMPQADGDDGQGEKGDGTAQSGYVTPDKGPFECGNCTHFDGQGSCDHPAVQSDPEVNGQVDAAGCCNFFKSSGGAKQNGDEGATGPEAEGEAGAVASGTNDAGGYA